MASGSEGYARINAVRRRGTAASRRRGIQRVVTDRALQELVGF